MARITRQNKENLPPGVGRDLNSSSVHNALNQKNKNLKNSRAVSGSSNRVGGYDIHPHSGDHGEAQKQGSPSDEDYQGVLLDDKMEDKAG